MRRMLFFGLCVVIVSGCGSSTSMPEIPPTHPASTAVEVEPLDRPSGLLDHHDPLPALSVDASPEAPMDQHDMHRHGAMDTAPDSSEAMSAAQQEADPESPPAGHEGHQPEDPEMEPQETSVHDDHDQQAVTWVCPMHPNQTSPVKANCPVCGMEMVPKPPQEEN